MAIESQTAAAFFYVLWGLLHVNPFVMLCARTLKKLRANVEMRSTVRYAWSGFIAFGILTGGLASVGVTLAFTTFASDDTMWLAAMICAVLQPLALGVWAYLAYPGHSGHNVKEDMIGLVPATGLAISTTFLLGYAKSSGAVGNFVPMGFYISFAVWHLALLIYRVWEIASFKNGGGGKRTSLLGATEMVSRDASFSQSGRETGDLSKYSIRA